MPAPRADRRPVTRVHHEDTFADAYEWLRDPEDPEVLEYLKAETAWTVDQISDQADLREQLFTELSTRTQQTDLSVASWVTHHDGDEQTHWWYYSRTVEGSEYAIHCRVPAADRDLPPDASAGPVAGEEILLDENRAADGHDFYSVGDCDVSPNGRWLAWSEDTTGNERYALRFRELATGTVLEETIPDTMPGSVWAGNDTVFYTRADESWRPHQVVRHQLHTSAVDDAVVAEEPDERFWMGVDISADEKWVLINSSSKITSEVSFLPVDEPCCEPRVVAERRSGVEYDVDIAEDRLFILHNDGAVDFMLSQAELATPDLWETVLEPAPGERFVGLDLHRDHVILALRRDGLTALDVMDRDPLGRIDLASRRTVTVDEPLRTIGLVAEPDYVTDRFRFTHTSLLTPQRVVEQHVITGAQRVLKETSVLDEPAQGAYHRDNYVQERLWATADDGTRIPISVVRRRDTPIDGSAAMIVYGYGAYEISTEPGFANWRLSLLDRGVVWAIIHVRGGGEMGRSWYEQGKFAAKPNSFSDFVAGTRHLVDHGYAHPDRVGAFGGSAGGLLMGAVTNLAPELYRAVLASVPFVDPLTSMLMPELPLTAVEWEEWGDPINDPEIYRVMKSYAPYENVRPTHYPAILASTSLHDTRVLVVEPAKWVAQLRQTATNDDADILLYVEMAGGHGGASGRYQLWRMICREFAWLLTQLDATALGPRLAP